jgi:hypothetical protein
MRAPAERRPGRPLAAQIEHSVEVRGRRMSAEPIGSARVCHAQREFRLSRDPSDVQLVGTQDLAPHASEQQHSPARSAVLTLDASANREYGKSDKNRAKDTKDNAQHRTRASERPLRGADDRSRGSQTVGRRVNGTLDL